jgi:hypothetical protein
MKFRSHLGKDRYEVDPSSHRSYTPKMLLHSTAIERLTVISVSASAVYDVLDDVSDN